MGTDGEPWPRGEVRATPGQTVRAMDARARQTRPSPGTEAGQGQRGVVSCSLQSQLTQGGSQGTPGRPGPPGGQGPVPGLGEQGAFRGTVRPGPAPTGSPVPALGSWASHSLSDRVFKGDAGLGGGGPRASGVLGSDVGGVWERQARPQRPPVAHEAGRSHLLCVWWVKPDLQLSPPRPCHATCTLGAAGHHSLAFPPGRACGPDPAQPASLAHPPEFPDGECHPPPRARPIPCPPRPAPRAPPTVGALLRGPVALRPLCRVPTGFRTACLAASTALLKSVQPPPPLCLLEVEPEHLHFRYCPEDLEATALWLPPAPGHQNPVSMRHPPGS